MRTEGDAEDYERVSKYQKTFLKGDHRVPRSDFARIFNLRSRLPRHTNAFWAVDARLASQPPLLERYTLYRQKDEHEHGVERMLREARQIFFPLHDSEHHNPFHLLHPQHFFYELAPRESVPYVFSRSVPKGWDVPKLVFVAVAATSGRPQDNHTVRSVVAAAAMKAAAIAAAATAAAEEHAVLADGPVQPDAVARDPDGGVVAQTRPRKHLSLRGDAIQ